MSEEQEAFPPEPPLPHVVDVARRIRMLFGHGGTRFPGSEELFAAADKIEAWAAAVPPPEIDNR